MKNTSLIGLAVVSTPGYHQRQYQFVVLDAMMHMSQKFIFTEPFQVEFKDDFKSCALISESECLALTWKKVILISLIDHTQKQVSFPQGVTMSFRSLNVMVNGEPCFIITTSLWGGGFYEKTISDIYEQYP